MARAYIGIGSNLEPRRHIKSALQVLEETFEVATVSNIYRTMAVGFEGPDFFNLVAGVDTELEVSALVALLHHIEYSHGRRRGSGIPKHGSRTLDLDLLLYDDLILDEGNVRLPHDDITRYDFVLQPLAEIAGNHCHPRLGIPLYQLWQKFSAERSELRPVTL